MKTVVNIKLPSWNCRIGNVTYKNKNIRSLPNHNMTAISKGMLDAAREGIKEIPNPKGYALVVWGEDRGKAYANYHTSNLSPYELINYVSEALRWRMYQ